MTQELLAKYTPRIESLILVPSSGGRFELSVDGEMLYSKKSLGRHAEPGEIARLLGERYEFAETPVD